VEVTVPERVGDPDPLVVCVLVRDTVTVPDPLPDCVTVPEPDVV
jgi:hypothetical protein